MTNKIRALQIVFLRNGRFIEIGPIVKTVEYILQGEKMILSKNEMTVLLFMNIYCG